MVLTVAINYGLTSRHGKVTCRPVAANDSVGSSVFPDPGVTAQCARRVRYREELKVSSHAVVPLREVEDVEDDPVAEAPVPEIDVTQPHSARMYDYFLGGKNHFAADRELADKVLEFMPSLRLAARENRAFLGRAVRFLAAEAGIRQFLDIGTGLPTAGNTHEVAQRVAPPARVVYADNDPLVLAHARALLTSSPEGRTAYVHADLRNPESILGDPAVREVLDFSQPVALMLIAVLHFIPDEDKPGEIIATLLDALPPGSYLAATHLSEEHSRGSVASITSSTSASSVPGQLRDSDVFARLAFTGLELVPPGVVLVSEWRPDKPGPRPTPAEVDIYGGVGRKPLRIDRITLASGVSLTGYGWMAWRP